MKRKMMSFIVHMGCMIILPGCGRILDWSHATFEQAHEVQTVPAPRQYLRSLVKYDQFTTVAMFDALWLSDDVRTAYAQLNAVKHGKSLELSNAFLRRQLEENKHFISFYVLTPFDIILNDKYCPWSIMLDIDGVLFSPIETKITELSPEYESFFGKKLNQFKAIHLVKFNAQDVEEKPLITRDTQSLKVRFRSINRDVALEWQLRDGMLAGD